MVRHLEIYERKVMLEKYLSDFNLNYLIYMSVGTHLKESLDDIMGVKLKILCIMWEYSINIKNLFDWI